MRTIVISDLHLAAGNDADLLRSEAFREHLWPTLAGADRVVLLGDIVELRDRPLRDAVEIATPFFSELAAVVDGAEIVLVAGNHDHRLVEPWLEERAIEGAGALGLEELVPVRSWDWAGGRIARALPPDARLAQFYPGIWLRDDVYATHGHYLDRHLTVPSFERLGVAAVERAIGATRTGSDPLEHPEQREPGRPDEYERILAPVYAFLYGLAQASESEPRGAGSPSARLWRALSDGGDGAASRIRGWLLGSVALPGAVGMANRLGLGPVNADLSAAAIARAGFDAMGEVTERLQIGASHLIFGHTHRRGPIAGEEPRHVGGIELHNTGSWVYSPGIIGAQAARSGYWPGTIAVVDGEDPPRLEHLLDGLNREDFAGLSG